MYILFFLVSLFASLIGAICGVGGGIIIKPLLDTFGVLDVSAISFLSGCTVLSMSVYSVVRAKVKKEVPINYTVSTSLAVGAVVGGIFGKAMFQMIWDHAFNKNSVGSTQSIILLIITLGTLIYTLKMSKIKTLIIDNILITAMIGMLLGLISSFLGIGGGPVNLIVLFFFFSMNIKTAAENSIYIILFSQLILFIKHSSNASDTKCRYYADRFDDLWRYRWWCDRQTIE